MIQVVFQLNQYKEGFIFGKKGPSEMLWKNQSDLKKFKELTTQSNRSVLIMGSSTFKSLKNRLPDRAHYVFQSKTDLSKIKNQSGEMPDYIINSIDDFRELMKSNDQEDILFSIIGGFDLIKELIKNQYVHQCLDQTSHECDHSHSGYEIIDLYITILNENVNTTGDLITINNSDIHEIIKDYQLLEILTLNENALLYHYRKK